MKKVAFIIALAALATSCTTVESGHKGVEVSWGGETNLNVVHPEGMNVGVHWVWDDMIEYDVREKTMTHKFEFNDKNNMTTNIELALDYRLSPNSVNLLHSQITDVETKIIKTLKSAGKEIVPRYSAVELNISKRTEAEQALSSIISDELPEFYVEFRRLQMTDVDIPEKVAGLAEETAVQLGRNELAKKKEAEQVALAKARVAKATGDADAQIARAKGEYEAAQYDAKTKKLLASPAILELKKLEVDMEWAKKGTSPYGNNNVFGSETAVFKGMK